MKSLKLTLLFPVLRSLLGNLTDVSDHNVGSEFSLGVEDYLAHFQNASKSRCG